jgi:hypothetical protein
MATLLTNPPDTKAGAVPASSEKTTSDDGRQNQEDGYGSSDEHVFSDPVTADYWRKVYEQASYENRHRFDPDFKWTAEEEKKLVRRIDKRIMVWAWIMFCALDLHRRNINRAISDNMVSRSPADVKGPSR